jgi:protein-tyrosine phosphatase
MTALREMLKRLVKDPLSDGFWALAGRGIRNPATNPDARSFLFVCTGNICRSPFCAGVAEKISRERRRGSIVSESAGIEVSHSLPPPEEAIHAADRFGVDLRGHRSRRVDAGLLERFDAVMVMEAWQYRRMRGNFPGFREKIFLLPLFDDDGTAREGHYKAFHIEDPFGKPDEQFHRCFQRIVRCVEAVLKTMTR